MRQAEVRLRAAPNPEPEEAESEFGFHVQEITEVLFRTHRLARRQGAFVSFVARGSPAAEAGLAGGDVVAEIEGRRVDDLAAFRNAIGAVREANGFW